MESVGLKMVLTSIKKMIKALLHSNVLRNMVWMMHFFLALKRKKMSFDVFQGREDLVRALLQNKADPNIRDSGQSAFALALKNGNIFQFTHFTRL